MKSDTPGTKQLQSAIFFIGWVLSPLTTWNDLFINVPLSYLIANFLYFLIRLPFKWLLIASYILTNILGLLLMYVSGKEVILSAESKMKGILSLAVNTAILSLAVYLLDKSGILLPLSDYLSKFYHHQN